MAKVLIACEFSATVRDSFIKEGHDAVSCDLIDTDIPGPHIKGDVRDVLGDGWDAMIAFPPCTFLCKMGIWWNHKRPERWEHTEEAIEFVQCLMDAPINRIAIENPVGILSRRIRKPEQTVQPFHHGDEATKLTCLWLKNLPLLEKTNVVGEGKFYVKKNGARAAAWSHTTSGTRKELRKKIASKTFPGIATAMAEQWGPILEDPGNG